jgi:hypothetical protein
LPALRCNPEVSKMKLERQEKHDGPNRNTDLPTRGDRAKMAGSLGG